MVLPVPPTIPDEPDATAEQWEQAAPTYPDGPRMLIGGGSVAMYRSGPGDYPQSRDEWMGVDLRDVPHDGVESGRSLFVEIPGPPPEGHGGYDFDGQAVIDRAGQRSALFWSDWNATTAANQGGHGSFRGDHVIIARIPPGSTQGYMPTQMEQLNTSRQAPGPWDTQLTIGGASVSM
jgi:hypothetical protein